LCRAVERQRGNAISVGAEKQRFGGSQFFSSSAHSGFLPCSGRPFGLFEIQHSGSLARCQGQKRRVISGFPANFHLGLLLFACHEGEQQPV
jgi:hypothetical protein